MSIINNILNEIEKNKENNSLEQSKQEHLELGSAFSNHKSKFFNLFTLTIIAIFLVIILSLSLLFMHKKHSISPTEKVVEIPKQKEKINEPTAAIFSKTVPASEATTELNNININVDGDKTIVNFVISHDTYYYVEHGQDAQQLKLTLGNTTYTNEPVVNLTHTAIKKLSAQKINNNTEIEIDLVPNTQIIGLQIYNQPQTQLQLVLLNSNISAATIKKTALPLTPQQRATQAYQEALALTASNKTDEAIKKLYESIETSSDTKTYELLATLLSKKNKFTEANKILLSASKMFPDNPKFTLLRAYVLAQSGQTAQALQLVLKNLPPVQQNPDYYAFIATLYQQQGQFMLAAQIYNQLLKIYPSRAQWWLGLGLSLESADKKNAAQEAYRKAISLGDLPPETQLYLNNKLSK